MKKLLSLATMFAFASTLAFAAGCKSEDKGGAAKPAEKKDEKKPEEAKPEEKKPEEAKPAEGEAKPAEGEAAAAGSTGVPECDAYMAEIEKLAKCDKMPAEAKKPLQDSFEAQKAGWATLKDGPPEAKTAAAGGCKTAAEAVANAAKAAGCE